jgi:hypothetical protein
VDWGTASANVRRAGWLRSISAPQAVFLLGVVLGMVVRRWQMLGRDMVLYVDSRDYVDGARASWLSADLWVGRRPPGMLVLFKLIGGDTGTFAIVTVSAAAVGWAALAAVVVWALGRAGGRLVPAIAGVVILTFSLSTPVTMWDRSVLSESLAIALLAVACAAVVIIAVAPTGRRAAALIAVLALWASLRDSHTAVLAIGGIGLLAVLVARHVHRRDDSGGRPVYPLLVLGVGLLVLVLLSGIGSSRGERHVVPLQHVFEVRVLPYPDRVTWFAGHGMPQADKFVGPEVVAPVESPGLPTAVQLDVEDASLRPWFEWLRADGRTTFARWVAAHPTYILTEPFRSPERGLNFEWGDRMAYAPEDLRRVPAVDRVLDLPTPVVGVVAVGVVVWVCLRRAWRPAVVAALVTAALAVPHGLFAWHSDGIETTRHLTVPALQFHLGTLVAVVAALSTEVTRSRRQIATSSDTCSGPAPPGTDGDEPVDTTVRDARPEFVLARRKDESRSRSSSVRRAAGLVERRARRQDEGKARDEAAENTRRRPPRDEPTLR